MAAKFRDNASEELRYRPKQDFWGYAPPVVYGKENIAQRSAIVKLALCAAFFLGHGWCYRSIRILTCFVIIQVDKDKADNAEESHSDEAEEHFDEVSGEHIFIIS